MRSMQKCFILGKYTIGFKDDFIKYNELKGFKTITNDINTMKKMKNLKLKLGGMSDLYGYFYTLNDNGVKYTIKNNIKDKNLRYMYSWRIGVEVDE